MNSREGETKAPYVLQEENDDAAFQKMAWAQAGPGPALWLPNVFTSVRDARGPIPGVGGPLHRGMWVFRACLGYRRSEHPGVRSGAPSALKQWRASGTTIQTYSIG